MDGVDEPCSPTPPTGHQHQSGHLMCYEGRTSSRAIDRATLAFRPWPVTHTSTSRARHQAPLVAAIVDSDPGVACSSGNLADRMNPALRRVRQAHERVHFLRRWCMDTRNWGKFPG